MSEALIHTLAITFALQPGMAARLLSEHRDDGSGRCRVCPAGQGIRQRWPCQIHWYASRAAAALEEEARTRETSALFDAIGDKIHPRLVRSPSAGRIAGSRMEHHPKIEPRST